jgi:SAM-dependent methyltransferase
MAYADITIRDRNPVKRWIQRRRFSDALKALRGDWLGDRLGDRLRILDFGAGDGELVYQMASIASIEAWVFEPIPSMMAEARGKLAALSSVVFVDSLDPVESGIFDYVFCLEVFEHLPEMETVEAIVEIHRLLKPGGVAVIGVPHELFLPALLKGLFRMSRRYGAFDASPRNILAAFRGRPPLQRPVAEISAGFSYHFYHLGFDYRMLERMLQKRLQLVERWFSPFPILGTALNSEVYFLLRKTRPAVAADAPQGARR